ncbi:MAG: c-type cytochrome, partial [Bacteroidales bacterium]|nr:c-type cytochrome [Bacteroidales bacterium]
MKEKQYIQAFQWTVTIASLLLIILLLVAWIVTGPRQEWRQVQRQYTRLSEQLSEATGEASVAFFDKGIHQFESSDLRRIDRCVTCHLGIENPQMDQAPQPFTSHPGDLFTHHPPDKYGCTICHGGQGRALNMREAHGIDHDTHWDQPLLSHTYIQSSCGKCHLSIFSEEQIFEGIPVFQEGQKIFEREGCLGCHKARGVGGIIGPDLTEQGEKTRHEYSFQNIETEQTISNWLKEHFRDPEMVSPGSLMLKIDLPEEELDALTTFVLGLAKPDIAFEYFSLETLNEFKGNRSSLNAGRALSMACSGCHGREGAGKSYEEYKTGVPAIRGVDFQ